MALDGVGQISVLGGGSVLRASWDEPTSAFGTDRLSVYRISARLASAARAASCLPRHSDQFAQGESERTGHCGKHERGPPNGAERYQSELARSKEGAIVADGRPSQGWRRGCPEHLNRPKKSLPCVACQKSSRPARALDDKDLAILITRSEEAADFVGEWQHLS